MREEESERERESERKRVRGREEKRGRVRGRERGEAVKRTGGHDSGNKLLGLVSDNGELDAH